MVFNIPQNSLYAMAAVVGLLIVATVIRLLLKYKLVHPSIREDWGSFCELVGRLSYATMHHRLLILQ